MAECLWTVSSSGLLGSGLSPRHPLAPDLPVVVLVFGPPHDVKQAVIARWVAQTGGEHLSPTHEAWRQYAATQGVLVGDLFSSPRRHRHAAEYARFVERETGKHGVLVFDLPVAARIDNIHGGVVFVDVQMRAQCDFYSMYGAVRVHVARPDDYATVLCADFVCAPYDALDADAVARLAERRQRVRAH
jgi:hypothetical protein